MYICTAILILVVAMCDTILHVREGSFFIKSLGVWKLQKKKKSPFELLTFLKARGTQKWLAARSSLYDAPRQQLFISWLYHI